MMKNLKKNIYYRTHLIIIIIIWNKQNETIDFFRHKMYVQNVSYPVAQRKRGKKLNQCPSSRPSKMAAMKLKTIY